MGSRSYANPTESGYLQRKNSGYITFDSYKFEITTGTKLSVAAAAIAAYLTSAGVAVVVGIVTNLLCSLLQVTVDAVIDHNVNGNFRCREYRWDYRVRRNSNIGAAYLLLALIAFSIAIAEYAYHIDLGYLICAVLYMIPILYIIYINKRFNIHILSKK